MIEKDNIWLSYCYGLSKIEPCLYTKDNNSLNTIVTLYVDVVFVFSNNTLEIYNLKNVLVLQFKHKVLEKVKLLKSSAEEIC